MGLILGLVQPFLTVLGAILGKHPSAADPATPLPGWLTAIENLGAAVGDLTGNWVQDAQSLLSAIAGNGAALGIPTNILTGVTNVNAALTKYAATAADYTQGQVAVIAKFSFEGVPGTDFAISDAGLATQLPPGVTTIGGALGII
jgi:hypothetical protein